jgi:DNA topoisomerase-1
MFFSRRDSTAVARAGGAAASGAASVRGASLNYVSDAGPGMSRRRAGRRFVYFDPAGRCVRDPEVIARVTALAIPPAYTSVWICPDPDGHIQATARDARGRKQYRYHPRWRAVRDATKFERMLAFGKALPRIRKQVEADLARAGMPREKVLATVVRLLETTLMRIGNDEYVKRNRSYGLTTLENRHVNLSGNGVRFEFKGKSGIVHRVTVQEPRIARIIRRCLDIPGHDLFSYLDEEGAPHPIRSTEVNAYLQAAAGADFTAKDYRTWAASVLAMSRLAHLPREPQRTARSNVVAVMKAVAERLGNTAAICRKSYVHPAVCEAYLAGTLKNGVRRSAGGMDLGETRFLRFLRTRG